MTRVLLTAILALGVSGCVTTQADLTAAVAKAQAATKRACAYAPTAQLLSEVLAADGVDLRDEAAVARYVCARAGRRAR